MKPIRPQGDSVSSLWFKYQPTYEIALMQDATALQIAMRSLLRDRYWLTDCQPLGPVAIRKVRLRMAALNPRDVITDEEVDELLTPEFGFQREVSKEGEFIGYHLPDLAIHRVDLLEARATEAARKAVYRTKKATGSDLKPKPGAGSTTVPGNPMHMETDDFTDF